MSFLPQQLLRRISVELKSIRPLARLVKIERRLAVPTYAPPVYLT
jgi:hypothetical protein